MVAMTEDAVRLDIDGRVAIVTLTRPERRNALDAAVCTGVTDALRVAVPDAANNTDGAPQIRAVLLRGEGPVFCAGANLGGGVYSEDFFAALEQMLTTIVELPIPVIADLQGPAVGAGCQLALASDLRIIGPHGELWVPAVNHGFALDPWTVRRAVELFGGARARNMLIAGAHVDQQEALACGFAIAAGDADDALAFAHQVAAQAPLATMWFKKALNNPGAQTLAEEALACWTSQDVKEARNARAENRTPNFEGR